MPEAAVHKYYGTRCRKYDVGLTRQAFGMQAIPKSARMKTPSQYKFGARVFRPNSRHVEAALLRR
jgi:hypothetical protein